jgi:hypothetical protein
LLYDTESAPGLGVAGVATRHLDEVGMTFDQPDHISDEGRLAGPVRAEKGDQLSRFDGQIDTGESRVVPVSVNQTSYFEYMFHLEPPSALIMREEGWGR